VEVDRVVRPFRERLTVLNERLAAWQAQVKVEVEVEFAKLNKSGKIHDSEGQQQAAQLALARAGDGPRHELNVAIDELCDLYLKSDSEQRAAIRALLRQHGHIFHDLWGYVRRAAEQVRAGGGELWCRFGLAVVSMEDMLTDLTDTVEGLMELHQAAVQNGVDPTPLFKEVAALSSDERHEGRQFSTRQFLQDFDPARVPYKSR
jgi:hypothetical protein